MAERTLLAREAVRSAGATGVAVRADPRTGRSVLAELRPAAPWSPRPLPPDGAFARVALVQTAATLLSGDAVALEIVVGAGAALELVETSATVAHDARGGPTASVRVHVRLGAGARLRWLAQPLVLAAGCRVRRTTEVTLARDARALLRETVVLGRSGEQPGALDGVMRVTCDGRPLLVERLDTRDAAHLRSPLVAGDAAVLDTLCLLGVRGAAAPGASPLHGPGSMLRELRARSEVATSCDAVAAAWGRALEEPAPAYPA